MFAEIRDDDHAADFDVSLQYGVTFRPAVFAEFRRSCCIEAEQLQRRIIQEIGSS